ncbi:MAG TPA: NAD(P)H-binding protein, partial [Anaerolineales bacterium]|nr:NAD(P)H-binding protein [Anaerolineales bacterium]
RLLENGYTVRCMARDDAKLAGRPWREQVEVVCADIAEPGSLVPALEDVDSAYYLIHNMASGHNYHHLELEGADNFAQAAHQARVSHIIYLGGLANPHEDIAPHMRSRIETGNILRQNHVPVTEFRAGVIVGPGSISFEMIRYLAEHFPILVGPVWLKNKSQPISAENVIDYLLAALDNPQCRGKTFEIGGQDVMTYAETMTGYCRMRQMSRPVWIVPYLPTFLMAYFVDKLTPVQASIAYPLIEGLKSSSVVSDPHALDIFPQIIPQGFTESVQQSLDKLHPNHISRQWRGQARQKSCIKSEGFLISSLEIPLAGPVDELFARLLAFAKSRQADFPLDSMEKNRCILVQDTRPARGVRWIEWDILSKPDGPLILRQTGYFAPRGLLGFLSQLHWLAGLRETFRQIQVKE